MWAGAVVWRPLPRGEGRLFTIPDLRVHHADLGVHVAPILAFTLDRSGCSPWAETRTQHLLPVASNAFSSPMNRSAAAGPPDLPRVRPAGRARLWRFPVP